MKLAHLKLINRVAQNQNFTYFAFGFSVISLMINKPMLEIHLESIQHGQLDRNVKLSLADRKCR